MNKPAERDEELIEKTESREEKFSGDLLRLTVNRVRTPDGSTARREVVHHPGGVVIAPLLGDSGSRKLVLVRQYREPAGRPLWELPAGTREKGESSRSCARRELIEETEYQPGNLEKKVDLFTSPGYTDEVLTLYEARNLKKVSEPDTVETPEDENLFVKKFPLEEVFSLAREGKISDGKTLAGLFFLI